MAKKIAKNRLSSRAYRREVYSGDGFPLYLLYFFIYVSIIFRFNAIKF